MDDWIRPVGPNGTREILGMLPAVRRDSRSLPKSETNDENGTRSWFATHR